MSKKYKISLHIFRRDLRLQDNSALNAALQNSENVIPCFIVDNRQVIQNPYRSDNALQFMAGCLGDLNGQLEALGSKLYLFNGIAEDIVGALIRSTQIEAVYCNRDYTPFSKLRDNNLKNICNKHKIAYYSLPDTLITEPEEIFTNHGTPYTIFTAFLRNVVTHEVRKPYTMTSGKFYGLGIDKSKNFKEILSKYLNQNRNLILKGGRVEALKLLKSVKKLSDYESIRNFPNRKGTSFLSAHIKFGTLSIREFYFAILRYFNSSHSLIRELYWRDFFTHIAFHYPGVFGNSFHKKYDQIVWENDPSKFKSWCNGETGFPIVDAGMRQLNTTGWMHNRVRMIVASFLIKDLHVDWRWGEKYFAQKLIDYDPSVNNGNWQWAASTGCDAQPYFRIFNPWRQQLKFDPDCHYIKNWIPELKKYSSDQIHNLYKQFSSSCNYIEMIIDHDQAASEVRKAFASISKE